MDIDATLKEISTRGTVRIAVRCFGRGYQIKGYHGNPPQPFDLRCGPEKSFGELVQEARNLQLETDLHQKALEAREQKSR